MKYSIITVNYNNREGLRKTIESVIHQTFRDFEFIVIDGGSTDGSAEVLKEYDAQRHPEGSGRIPELHELRRLLLC